MGIIDKYKVGQFLETKDESYILSCTIVEIKFYRPIKEIPSFVKKRYILRDTSGRLYDMNIDPVIDLFNIKN